MTDYVPMDREEVRKDILARKALDYVSLEGLRIRVEKLERLCEQCYRESKGEGP